MNTTEKKEHTHLVIWGLIVIILVLFLIYLGFAAFYSSHFLPGTTINGVDASGKNVEAIEEQIAQEMNEYEIKIIAREGKTEVLKGEDIVLKPIFDGSIQKELKEQDCFIWPAAFFDEFQIQIETMVFFDKAALKRKVNTLDILDRNKMKKPENAVVSEYHKEEGYIIIPEKEGTKIGRASCRERV